MSNKYSDYFEIDEGYFPEINESSIKDRSNKWQDTYPHESFVALLKATERMLARGSHSDKKGIWIEGAYGTGKSRILWTLQNLMDCSVEEFNAYFDQFEALQAEPDLRTKFLGHKQGKIITAYRYASSSIDGDRSLIVAVYESLTTALRRAKVTKLGAAALRGKICEWLSDKLNHEYFNNLLTLPEYRGMGSFAGKNADDIIRVLQNTNSNVENLVQDIFKLADDRGIRALSINMDTLIAWITEVIDSNKLKAIVLFWDEFSDYFQKNKYNLGEFQKLVELSSIKPFYLAIVTHQSGSIFEESNKDRNRVQDRFVRKAIELPEPIAFELIRQALKVKDAQKDNWVPLANDMNEGMTAPRAEICKTVWKNQPEKGESIMQGLLPIHPFAALLLKYISTAFASNQRSMFNFIKTPETENLHAFQWFINTYGPNEGNVLSIDFLWNFFYEKGPDEHSSGIGRSNLDVVVRTILDVYPRNEGRLMEDEKRVLKTILMMQAMSQKLNDSVEHFLTTDKNINWAFAGTDLESRFKPSNLAKKLVQDGILYLEPLGKNRFRYSAAAISGDQTQIDEIKKDKRKKKTRDLIGIDSSFDSVLNLTPALSLRYEIRTATVEDFTKICNGLRNEPSTYKFHVVLCLARNEDEQEKLRKLLTAARSNEDYKNLVFVDASSTLLNNDRYEQWIEFSANEEYWLPKDRKLATEKARNAMEILEDWQMDISNGSFTVHSSSLPSPTHCGTAAVVRDTLFDIIRRKYPWSLDNVQTTEVMWKSSSLNIAAKHGINGTSGNSIPSGILDLIGKEQPTLGKLRELVQKRIDQEFQNEGRIAIGDIFDLLMAHGFMPCNLYSYLTGYLLKDYVSDTYRSSDGDVSSPMDTGKLSDIIAGYIKHTNTPTPRYREQFIEIMTPDQKSFVDLAAGVFGISNTLSVEDVISQIRSALKNLGFPLWCFKEIDTLGLGQFLDMFAQVANPQNVQETTPQIVSKLGRMSRATPTAAVNLAQLLTKENGREAMTCFLEHFENGDVLRIGEKTGAEVLLDIRNLFDKNRTEALWLWDREIGEEEIRKLLTNYRIVDESNHLISRSSSLSDCLRQWREKARSIKVPYAALVSEVPQSFKKFLQMWKDIVDMGELSHNQRETFLHELENISSEFVPWMDSMRDIFKKVYSIHLGHFTDGEIQELYSKLPMGMFEKNRPDAENEVSNHAVEMRQKQVKYKLSQLWQEKTATKSPKDWSSKNQTPIAIMVPGEDASFRRVFGAFMPGASDSDIKFALEFLQNQVDFFANLADKAKVDAAFARRMIGKYSVLLPDVEEVRSHLADKFDEAYYWYPDSSVQAAIEKMAQARYSQSGYKKVLKHIEQMDARKVKEYLKRLIKDNMTVGIEMILETGDET